MKDRFTGYMKNKFAYHKPERKKAGKQSGVALTRTITRHALMTEQ